MEREGGGGAVRKMRDCHCSGCAAVFVEEDDVRTRGGFGRVEEGREDEVAAVEAY